MQPLTIEEARTWYDDDPTHGFGHILRVLRMAEVFAQETGADADVVRAAALLHDATGASGHLESAARGEHHHASAAFARDVLAAKGWPEAKIAAVEEAIRTHRFRTGDPPRTLEAQVLFDADKLDAIGAVGVARAIAYAVSHGSPIYAPPSAQFLETGEKAPGEPHSAYHEYLFKLRRLRERLFTPAARAVAARRDAVMRAYFDALADEMEGRDLQAEDWHAPEALIGPLLVERGWRLATAESCTGGLIGSRITDIPGSSAYFAGGVMAYAYDAKVRLLGVPWRVLEAHGAVSEPVVRLMAAGVKRALTADVAIAVSGVAGPGGGTPEKPVGTTWIAISTPEGTWARRFVWPHDRVGNKKATAAHALAWLLEILHRGV